ncbi:MAG: AlpA family phage regulatory protein [Pseudoxanthomonas sp.]
MNTATLPSNTAAPAAPCRFERYDELKQRGIPYSRVHLARLIEAGEFPAPVKLSSGGRIAFLSTELDDWMAQRAAARSAA